MSANEYINIITISELQILVLSYYTGTSSHYKSRPKTPESDDEEMTSEKLYGHGVCKWPGCDTPCENMKAFVR